MKRVKLPDKVKIVNTTVDGFGDAIILEEAVIDGAFFQGTSSKRNDDTDMLGTYDAHCYVDERSPFVLDYGYRLEGMYMLINLYGFDDNESWYRIEDVKLGIDKLCTNSVNNCHCFLTKCEPAAKNPIKPEESN